MNRFHKKLQQLKGQNRLRTLNAAQGIDLTSNDYLGMRGSTELRSAAIEAIEQGIDLGAAGSRLLRGHTHHHESLESYAADHFGAEKSLYFATGFQANLAIFQALPSRHDTIIFDELVHASSREGIHNSPAHSIKVAHNDLNAFEDALNRAHENRRESAIIWIAVESVYSMDGDIAPLEDLQNLAQKFDAYLIIDEAHATGVWGENGAGFAASLPQNNVITLHTCGKAVGVAGGLVCASAEIIDTLINTARGFIYSTAPPPLQAYLTQKSLEILAGEDGNHRRAALQKNITHMNAKSQILPIIIGEDAHALNVAQKLQNQGYDVRAIRPPTVPEGTSRLRISLSSNLTIDVLDQFQTALTKAMENKIAA